MSESQAPSPYPGRALLFLQTGFLLICELVMMIDHHVSLFIDLNLLMIDSDLMSITKQSRNFLQWQPTGVREGEEEYKSADEGQYDEDEIVSPADGATCCQQRSSIRQIRLTRMPLVRPEDTRRSSATPSKSISTFPLRGCAWERFLPKRPTPVL